MEPRAEPEISEPTLVSASATDSVLIWLEQTPEHSLLWSAQFPRLEAKTPIYRAGEKERLFYCALSPDSARVLLLVETEEDTDSGQQAELRLLHLGSKETRTISKVASADFKPRWCQNTAYLYAEIASNKVSVIRRTLDDQTSSLFSHTADYPRLQLHQLSPEGWLVLDRNSRYSFHGWVARPNTFGSEWIELTAKGKWARPLGWDGNEMLFVVRDAPNLSRFLKVPLGDSSIQELTLRGPTLARVGSVEQAYRCGTQVFYVGFETWSHSLFKLDLPSGELTRLSWGFEPAQAHAFEPAGDSRALIRVEGLFQLPSLYEVCGQEPWVRPLVKPKPSLDRHLFEIEHAENLEISPITVSPDAPVLLEAYGGFQESIRPYYDPVRVRWLQKGGKIVIARVQGEPRSHYGAVRALLELAATLRPGRLAYRGSSFGGTLGLVAMMVDPTAFDAVWVDAPLTDLLAFPEFFPGRTWIPELGDPSSPKDSERLRSYSPIHLLKRSEYPPLLVSTALKDPVVHASHSLRLVDQIQEKNPQALCLLQIQKRGIHHRPPLELDEYLSSTELLWSWAVAR